MSEQTLEIMHTIRDKFNLPFYLYYPIRFTCIVYCHRPVKEIGDHLFFLEENLNMDFLLNKITPKELEGLSWRNRSIIQKEINYFALKEIYERKLSNSEVSEDEM